MLDKLAAAESRYEQLMAEMSDPAVQADTAKFRTHSKELSEMQPLVEHFREYKDVADGRSPRPKSWSRIPTCASWRRRS